MKYPEFQRNLWLVFTPFRWFIMPVALGIFFLLAFTGRDFNALAEATRGAFVLIAVLWGASNAVESITEEKQAGTWDQQRMSALTPWAMTWGKMFGRTAFAWYGGVLCLIVYIGASYAISVPLASILIEAFTLIAVAVLSISLALMAGLLAPGSRGSFSFLLVGVVFYALFLLERVFNQDCGGESVCLAHWWLLAVSLKLFALFSALFFMLCAVFAAWRLMSSSMQVRTIPWPWPLFAILLGIYIAGFYKDEALSTLPLIVGGIGLLMTYLSLPILPGTSSSHEIAWRRLLICWQNKNWQRFLEAIPLWTLSFALAPLCVAVLTLMGDTFSWTEKMHSWSPAGMLLIATMVVLRDAGVYLFAALSRTAGKRTGIALLLYFLFINVLIPLLAQSSGAQGWAVFLQPLIGESLVESMCVAVIHISIVAALIGWRIKKLGKTYTPAP